MVADTFNAGHTEFLRQARALGGELIVGLYGDDDCEWFHRRPSLTILQRARAVAQCPHVDRVLPGAPVSLSQDWLREQGIDLVAHSGTLPERELLYWYRVPIELGMFRILSLASDSSSADLEGRLRVAQWPQPVSSSSLGAIARRRLQRWLPRVHRVLQRRSLVTGLHRLADALHGTPLDGRYWMVGGLLLGWAREGRPLGSDLHDADFAYLDEDHGRFLSSIPAMVNAGLEPLHRFSSADGRYVEHRLFGEGVQFDFFRLKRVGDRWQYSMFTAGDEPTELIAQVPAQSFVSFHFLGRTWRKVADHELALRSIYGDWRTDQPSWSYTSDRAVVARIPAPVLPYAWVWPKATALGPGERSLENNGSAYEASPRFPSIPTSNPVRDKVSPSD
jgi:Cytidylyltransferase-like